MKIAGQSLQLADTINHRASKSLILRYIGAAFEVKGNYDTALNYFEKSYEIASEIDSYRQVQDAALKLYQLHKTLSQPDKALKFHEKWVEMTNVINLAMADRASKEFQAKYENEKHVDEIGRLGFEDLNSEKLLSTQRIAIILTWLLILLVFIFGLIFYSRYRKIHTLKKNLDIQNELLIVRSEENETLLSEIHHRVKNNLQMITSLLNMQNRRVEDGKSKELLEMTNSRVKSIGLIHEHLYQNEQFSRINVKKYVTDLIAMLVKSLHNGNSINIQIDTADEETSIDNILPIGLIINELLTNSIKYAFIDHPSSRLDFQMKQQEDILRMKFSDNGLKKTNIEKGFGWTIIESTLDGVKGKASTFYKGGLHVDIEIKDYLLA